MTPQQTSAFVAASGIAPDELSTAIASAIAVVAILWVASMVLGSYLAWRDHQIELIDLMANAIRGSIVLLIFGFYLN